jgi:hypothetical protein
MSDTTNDKPPHVEAVRRRLEAAAQEQPEPRFGARRTRKDDRSPGRLRGQRLLFETDEQARLWGVQGKDVQK